MRVYFAHPATDYGTDRQAQAIEALRHHFVDAEIENPDQPHHQSGYAANGMGHFMAAVQSCSALAFLRFPDGSIGAGVGQEIFWAQIANIPVCEVFGGRIYGPVGLGPSPILTVDETRAKIAEIRGRSK